MTEEEKKVEFEYRKGWLIKQSFCDEFVRFLVEMYNKYGESVFAIQGISNKYMDIADFSKNFFTKSNVADVSVDGNANVKEKNIIQYDFENNKSLMKLNNLYRIYKGIKKTYNTKEAEKCIEKLISGELFINDLSSLKPYCYAFDLRELLEYGMPFVGGGLRIKGPKYSDTFIDLIIQSTAYISNQIVGAAAFPDFFVVLNKFYDKEFGSDYTEMFKEHSLMDKIKHPLRTIKFLFVQKSRVKKIKQHFQNIIYSFNYPYRGSQSAFVNLSIMDKGFLNSLFHGYKFYDGTEPNIDNSYDLSKCFFEYFVDINCREGLFTFPVMTLALSTDENNQFIDKELVSWVAKTNAMKSIGSTFIGEPTTLSSCCRLRSDTTKINDNGFQNSFGVGGLSIGSHRVAGLNLPRIALLEKDNDDILDEDLECLRRILYAHREIVAKQIKDGVLPLYTHNWMFLNKQYSTIGIIGAHEYAVNKGLDILTDGKEAIKELILKIESRTNKWSREYKEKGKSIMYNIEQIPGESMAVRLAELDKILGYNKAFDLYSNQYIPLTHGASIYDRFVLQGEMDNLTSGGSILHINIDDEKPLNKQQYLKLIETARENKCKYFAVNYCYSEDEHGNFIIGKHEVSPIDGSKIVNIYTRVVGFITPVAAWNKVRRLYEFPNRHFYKNENMEINNAA